GGGPRAGGVAAEVPPRGAARPRRRPDGAPRPRPLRRRLRGAQVIRLDGAHFAPINPGRNRSMDPRMRVASSNAHRTSSARQSDSKLELFGFDSLVNILGLKSMAEEPAQTPASPTDSEDIGITIGRPQETDPKLGTLMGVFVPCLQNILGIIYYIRFTWIVGMGGIWQSLVLVALCGACTFLTAISLSAIATNGAMKGGGPYYLIGRALGPEVGVSIGLCFFLGNAVAGAMYVLGAVETFLDAVPSAGLFQG
uniref:Amino acid permease/ SLC12A domain-containing protein n=1 Tax=Aegilops tauschii subsp. strangulata TaxID=200361 RepID=A0A453AEX1_AEGTS